MAGVGGMGAPAREVHLVIWAAARARARALASSPARQRIAEAGQQHDGWVGAVCAKPVLDGGKAAGAAATTSAVGRGQEAMAAARS